jgi:uncharacterized protein (TIGR00703 family)
MNELKEQLLLNTLVFETLGNPEKEREFKLKTLKKWGFDLVFGKKNGEESYFLASQKEEGQTYVDGNDSYEVTNILKELPKNSKVLAHIEMIEGKAYLFVDLEQDGEYKPILQVSAGEILLAFLKKHKFTHIIESIKNIASAAVLSKQKGSEGKPLSFEELPPVFRRFLREAKKIEKEMGFGRISLAYFGENKDKEHRYNLEWMVPTIALFDEAISQKIDKALAEIK